MSRARRSIARIAVETLELVQYAEHTRGGFTTGRWEGDALVTYTTHMKAGFLRKNGPPSSATTTSGGGAPLRFVT